MKTKLISMLLAGIMLVSLAACANDNDKPGSTPEESTKETDVQTTENVTTEDTTEEDSTEPTAELAFNEDLLSDIGLTYSELVNKRGEKVDAVQVEGGGIGFYFKNGYSGSYNWGIGDLDYGRELTREDGYPIPKDENGHLIAEEVQLPKQDVPCWNISQIDAKDVFRNTSFPFDITDIENIEGVKDCSYAQEGLYLNYCSGFSYNELEFIIDHNDKEKIDSDTKIVVYKPFVSE